MVTSHPIGIFDSGYGGLTVMKEIVSVLPAYDYIYLGDNARAPYGNRSFETVYRYTLQCVQWLFKKGCRLVILACNTASAKALRTIQQNDLTAIDHSHRVLGVIRPTTEILGAYTKTGKVGILATRGTVLSDSYVLEANKFFPSLQVYQEACPMWVPLIENNEHESEGADYFVKKHIDNILLREKNIDTIVLACTHYPLLKNKIHQFLPPGIALIMQGEIIAASLENYLLRHPEMDERCSKNNEYKFYTTDNPLAFDHQAGIFFGREIESKHAGL